MLTAELAGTRGAGHALPQPFRSEMEQAFGEDFGRVRVHTDGRAARLNQAVHAKAFTHGTDIYFERGLPDLDSGPGRHLMAHELSHVVQQSGSARAAPGLIQRTTHTSSTPTNCHNWRIPLPPWIAGSIAHGQIAAMLRIPPQSIPRATKLLMGIPNPPAITPHGFADLWRVDSQARIAEIKSTQTGDRVAQNEARHYAQRHNEWLARAPHSDVDDLRYLAGPMGTRLLTGGLLDLSSVTSTDLDLGPFWGDPLKNLHIEADALGAVVYWCTGTGLPASPVWYPVFRRMMNELRDLLQRGRRAIQSVLEGIVEGGRAVARWVQGVIGSVVEWGLENSRVLAFAALILLLLVAIVLLILSILAEPASGGTSTVGVVGSVAALAAAASGLLVLLGIGTPNLPTASQNLATALMPDQQAPATGADYERNTGTGGAPTTASAASGLIRDPTQDFFAALSPLRDPLAVLRTASQRLGTVPPAGVSRLREGAATLERSGDAATARYIRDHMARNGLV